jgi:hypothetical protein
MLPVGCGSAEAVHTWGVRRAYKSAFYRDDKSEIREI